MHRSAGPDRPPHTCTHSQSSIRFLARRRLDTTTKRSSSHKQIYYNDREQKERVARQQLLLAQAANALASALPSRARSVSDAERAGNSSKGSAQDAGDRRAQVNERAMARVLKQLQVQLDMQDGAVYIKRASTSTIALNARARVRVQCRPALLAQRLRCRTIYVDKRTLK
jgi:hypothetical protein